VADTRAAAATPKSEERSRFSTILHPPPRPPHKATNVGWRRLSTGSLMAAAMRLTVPDAPAFPVRQFQTSNTSLSRLKNALQRGTGDRFGEGLRLDLLTHFEKRLSTSEVDPADLPTERSPERYIAAEASLEMPNDDRLRPPLALLDAVGTRPMINCRSRGVYRGLGAADRA